MKAIQIHSFGGIETLAYEDVPRPEISADDVLIDVRAAGVNPVDWKIRQGYLRNFLKISLPLIPGWDVSGTVAEVGSNVTSLERGDEVFAFTDFNRNGTYAEFVAVKAANVALKPESLDHISAAAVPLAALTAWQSLFDRAKLAAGQKILIHAGAGGVGHFAIQFARWVGAHAASTASGRNVSFLKELGAHEVIDYTTTRFEDVFRDVDVVFDTMGGETRDRSWQVLKKGGILVTLLPPLPTEDLIATYEVRAASVFVQPNAMELGEIATLIDDGLVKPVIHAVFPLREARRAHELSQAGHVRGKIALDPSKPV